MGPITVTSSVTISSQAYTTANSRVALLEGYVVCSDGQLLAIQQGSFYKSRE